MSERDSDIDPLLEASRTVEIVPSSLLRAMGMRVRAARDERDAARAEVARLRGALSGLVDVLGAIATPADSPPPGGVRVPLADLLTGLVQDARAALEERGHGPS